MSTEKEKRINTLKEDLMTMEKERKSIESKLKEHRAVLEAVSRLDLINPTRLELILIS